MDFGELLHTAKKNESSKPQIQYYPTKFAPPKKEQRSKNVSVNVQKFLARKEAEEKKKQIEAFEKRNKLLALRSQDKKATRRVNVMLKRTKSASQAAIADALDTDNTSVTLVGPSQPDEDDYGYVSQESSALYNKMMEKYSKMPEEPKFPEAKKKISTNLNSTKDRVKAALEREKEEALLPHRRKRKHVEKSEDPDKNEDINCQPEPEIEKKEVTKKFKPAPLVNFSDLLKLAEKKQFEPVVIEPKKEDEERPLTKKQKKEMEREREWRERKESQNKIPNQSAPALNRIPKVNGSVSQVAEKVQKKSEDIDIKKISKVKDLSSNSSTMKMLDKNLNIAKNKYPPNIAELNRKSDQSILNGSKNSSMKLTEKVKVDTKSISQQNSLGHQSKSSGLNDTSKMLSAKKTQKQPLLDSKVKESTSQSGIKAKQYPPNAVKSKQLPPNELKSKQLPPNELKSKQLPPNELKSKQFPPSDLKPRGLPPNNLKPKQFPPADLKPKQFPPRDLKPKQFPPPDVRRHPKDIKRKPMVNKRRILDDDEEDYDPEMDDFIDDGPEEDQDYSRYISEIFGYDKRKYRYDDDDVDNMESSFAQQMKEEVISTKIGIMEDLEDMRQEEEAKKRKLLMKKRGKL